MGECRSNFIHLYIQTKTTNRYFNTLTLFEFVHFSSIVEYAKPEHVPVNYLPKENRIFCIRWARLNGYRTFRLKTVLSS